MRSPSELSRENVSGEIEIDVSRRLPKAFGWFLIFLSVVSVFAFGSDEIPILLLSIFFLTVFGVQCILSARNVEKIIVGKSSLTFLPVGAELSYSEIERVIVPSWADRFDTPPDALGALVFETNTERVRYVPGAILQWKNGCRINCSGSDGNKMLAAIRKHIAE